MQVSSLGKIRIRDSKNLVATVYCILSGCQVKCTSEYRGELITRVQRFSSLEYQWAEHRRRIKTEEKAEVVASVWVGKNFNQLLTALAVLHRMI